jgi:protease I
MEQKLKGKRVAILVTHGFEQVELTEPRKALQEAGATAHVVSPAEGRVKGWNFTQWGDELPVDVPLAQARADDYDALLLPGGVMNPDQLRIDLKALAFVEPFFDARKPVAVICHGPWTLIDAGVVRGRRITSWPSVRTDLKKRRRGLGGRGRGRRPGTRVEPQARRHSAVQREDDRGVRRRPALGGARRLRPEARRPDVTPAAIRTGCRGP